MKIEQKMRLSNVSLIKKFTEEYELSVDKNKKITSSGKHIITQKLKLITNERERELMRLKIQYGRVSVKVKKVIHSAFIEWLKKLPV